MVASRIRLRYAAKMIQCCSRIIINTKPHELTMYEQNPLVSILEQPDSPFASPNHLVPRPNRSALRDAARLSLT